MRSVRVLVVATHLPMLQALTQVVRRERRVGELWEAQTGQEALERVHACRPDLVLVDIPLPDLRGIDLAHQLKTLPYPPHVVLLTLGAVELYWDLLTVLGADTVMDKRHFVEGFTTFLERYSQKVGSKGGLALLEVQNRSIEGQAPPCYPDSFTVRPVEGVPQSGSSNWEKSSVACTSLCCNSASSTKRRRSYVSTPFFCSLRNTFSFWRSCLRAVLTWRR